MRAVSRARTSLPVLALALLAPATLAAGTASPWSDHQVVAVRLLAGAAPATATTGSDDPEGSAGHGGATAAWRLGLQFRLAPNWHVYWKHPGDAGAPPQVTVALAGSAPLESRLLYPPPRRIVLPGDLEALGYEGEVVYPLRAWESGKGAAGVAPPGLVATLDYVACAIECIPFHDELALGKGGADATVDSLLRAWEQRLPRAVSAIPGLTARLVYSAGSAPRLELDLGGSPLSGASPELFLEPSAGASYGRPERTARGTTARFVVPVRPDVAGALPPHLRVLWTVSGLRAAGAGVAASGTAEVAAGGAVMEGGTAGGATATGRSGGGALRSRTATALHAALAGALLGLAPPALAMLLLIAFRDEAPRRRMPPLLAAVAMAACLGLLALTTAGGGSAGSPPLAAAPIQALLALPALALALLLWLTPGAAARLPAAVAAPLAALLAVPWLPLSGVAPAPGSSVALTLALGFAVPTAAAALAAGRLPAVSSHGRSALGFLAAAGLVWSAYLLAPLVPASRLAMVQISWLAVALATRLAVGARGPRRGAWSLVAVLAALLGAWAA